MVVIEGPGKGRIFSETTSKFPIVRMPNNTIVATDSQMVEALRVMEQSEGRLDLNDPSVRARLAALSAEEYNRGGFTHEPPKIGLDRTWGEWYDDHRTVMRVLLFISGIYLGVAWNAW